MNPLRKVRSLLIDSLGFSKIEANGLITLWMLVVLAAVLPRRSDESVTISQSAISSKDWQQELVFSSKQSFNATHKTRVKRTFGAFDPNTSSVEHMVSVGVPELIAKRIALYREKGGRFRKPEDISKIYGMNDDLAQELVPFVVIAQSTETNYEQTPRTFEPNKPYTFELNSVTVEELQLIRGIGPYLSQSIVQYRERLGGFHSYDQLKEIKKLTPEIIADIKNQSTLVVNITPLDINSDSLKVLVRHPYIDYNMARILINYRKVHGNFKRPEDLRGIKVMSDSLYQKLTPYLSR